MLKTTFTLSLLSKLNTHAQQNCLAWFKMSADEDTELRDLVAQTLEANGTLGKLRVCVRRMLIFLSLICLKYCLVWHFVDCVCGT